MKFLLLGWVGLCTLTAQPSPGAGSIAGHVVNSLTSAPIRKASVVLSATALPIRLVADTDAEGRFQFYGLPPGNYKLSASRAGFLDRAARRLIALAPDGHVTDAAVRLPPQSVIAGRILDEEGDPVDRAQVFIFKQVYRDGRRQWERLNVGNLTTDTGEYRFANLTPGRYLVHARSQRPTADNRYGDRDPAHPIMDYVPAYYPNAPTEEEALPVDVAVGAELRGIEIQLFKRARPARFRVKGKITGVQGTPQISVNLVPNNGGNTMAVPPDYTFELAAVPGHYAVFASVYSDGPEAYGTGSVTVSENVGDVLVTMSPPPDVTGRITVVENGRQVKLQGVQVLLTRIPPYLPLFVHSDAAGKFTVPKPFPPGRYSLQVVATTLPEGCFVQAVKFGGQNVSPDDFEIRGSAQLEIILSNTAGQINGSVTEKDKPFPNATVTLISTVENARPIKLTAGEDGNFKFTGLRPGKYQLFAWEEIDEGLWQDPAFRKPYESKATEITVGPSETQTTQLRLIPAL